MNKVVATIEARTGSTRLPEKVLKSFPRIPGISMLGHIIERVKKSQRVDEVVVATTTLKRDEAICDVAEAHGVSWFQGPEDDILARLSGAIRQSSAGVLVSLTGDNPFIDPVFIDDMFDFWSRGFDYVGSTHMQHCRTWDAVRTFPAGVTSQIVKAELVLERDRALTDEALREKGLFSIYGDMEKRFTLGAFEAVGKYAGWRHPELRMTVDTSEDFELATEVYEALYPTDPGFSTGEAIKMIASSERLKAINASVHQIIAYEELEQA